MLTLKLFHLWQMKPDPKEIGNNLAKSIFKKYFKSWMRAFKAKTWM